VVTLRKIVRQDGPLQRRFRELLLRLRVGLSTIEDYRLLATRINNMTNDASRFQESIYLMHSNAEVNNHNLDKLSKIATGNQRICRIAAYHNTAQAKGISAVQMLGLEPELLLARGARVMLTSNEWTKTGLTNGANGTLRHLLRKPEDHLIC
jgi:ATP-dependent DNA helicase PIF1